MGYIFGLCEDFPPTPYLMTLPVPRFLLLPLPFLFLLPLELVGTLALHELDMQRQDFRKTQKFLIACHDSLHLLQLILQLLFFLTALFPMDRVSRFKPRQFSAKGIHFPLQRFFPLLDKVFDGKRLFQFFNEGRGFLKHGRVIEKRGFRQRGIFPKNLFRLLSLPLILLNALSQLFLTLLQCADKLP